MESPKKRCRRTLEHGHASDTVHDVTCESGDVSGCWEGEVNIIHLPTEVLYTVLECLSYHEISKARGICRRFRDVCNGILNHEFCKLKDCAQHLKTKIEDELDQRYETVKTCTSRKVIVSLPREQLSLKRGLHLLEVVISQLRLLRAVCYRFLFLNDVSSLICYPRSFFAGKIIDEIHRITTLVRLQKVERKDMRVDEFYNLVDKFIDFYHDRIEPTLAVNEAVIGRSILFGSKVIDLLDCCLNCDKNVNFTLDSQGWCHLKGEYKFHRSFFTCFLINHEDEEPLNERGQTVLHECLRHLSSRSNECYLWEKLIADENAVPQDMTFWMDGICEASLESEDFVYFFGHFSKRGYQRKFLGNDEIDGNEDQLDLTWKVDMRCRKELAPLEVLHQCVNNSPNEDEREGEEASTENSDHDLELRLEILCPAAAKDNNRLPSVYRFVITQKYLQEELATSQEMVIGPVDSVNSRVYNFSRNNDMWS